MEDRIKELGFVGLLIALFALVLLGDKMLSKASQKPEPLDSGTIYEERQLLDFRKGENIMKNG